MTLAVAFPRLYASSRKQGAFISDIIHMDSNGIISWDLDLSRRIYEEDMGEVAGITHLLESFRLSDEEDSRFWKLEKSGEFTVSSCYQLCHKSPPPDFPHKQVWDPIAPTKITFFAWQLHHNAIMTQDNMAKRGHVVVNRCVMCRMNAESVNHLMIHCPIASEVWNIFFDGFGVRWAMHKDVSQLFQERLNKSFSKEGNHLWRLLPYAVTWTLWNERNQRIFEDSERNIHQLILDIKASLFFWSTSSKNMNGKHFQELVSKWEILVRKE
ncbi:Reverse transcriptase zinc-binding domain [Macleaya cordata]|nr:Reverse transcriptase zinc-binding domain [Macleaya cordata]